MTLKKLFEILAWLNAASPHLLRPNSMIYGTSNGELNLTFIEQPERFVHDYLHSKGFVDNGNADGDYVYRPISRKKK